MRVPLIGVTPSQDDKTGRITVNQDYLDAVRRSGALPVLLPLFTEEGAWRDMLDAVDGLLLTGGADVDPACYGETRLPLCGAPAPLRDLEEFALCHLALARHLPILAICRGLQVLNCALGGTLYQDIETQYGPQLKHPRYEVPRDRVHQVTVAEGSRLGVMTGLAAFSVNSRHHQAVKSLGTGLRAVAWAEDGLIEGAELPGEPFVVGVQWHPESLSDYRPEAQALFNAFAAACGGKA